MARLLFLSILICELLIQANCACTTADERACQTALPGPPGKGVFQYSSCQRANLGARKCIYKCVINTCDSVCKETPNDAGNGNYIRGECIYDSITFRIGCYCYQN